MKKWIALLLALTFVLAGCGREEKETTPAEVTQAAPTETEPRKGPEPPLTVHFTKDLRVGCDKETGRQPVLNFLVQWLTVKTPENPAAGEKITEDLTAWNQDFIEKPPAEDAEIEPLDYDTCLQFAQEFFGEMGENFYPFAAERTYELSQKGRLFTAAGLDYFYMGGAHGSHLWEYRNYDVFTGQRILLEDLSSDPAALKERLLAAMVKLANEDPTVQEGINWFEPQDYEQALKPLIREGSWRLEDGFFVISSIEYELGAYAAGTVDFRIPLAELRDLIRPEYWPEEEGPGSLSLVEKTELPLLDSVSKGGQPVNLYLAPEGTVYDLTLSELKLYEDGVTFRPGDPLWFCGELSGWALELHVEIPELQPDLMVRWRDRTGTVHTQGLTMSGEDGHYFLMDVTMP